MGKNFFPASIFRETITKSQFLKDLKGGQPPGRGITGYRCRPRRGKYSWGGRAWCPRPPWWRRRRAPDGLQPRLKAGQNIGFQVIADDHRVFRMGLHLVQRGADNPRAGFADKKGERPAISSIGAHRRRRRERSRGRGSRGWWR